ncbi:hypothetical protein BD410DRAFT_620836 [Rickenella mellea]|uniref:Uncharacterized protein n=1 Tax=Rickenella mellea TaxID=50990 RepID=A0A4Y7PPL8_9AGAM|nr:hypothetical protein BD410DRAFT_620836 [Rickenella mellea]
MTLTPVTPFEEFYVRVCQKFGGAKGSTRTRTAGRSAFTISLTTNGPSRRRENCPKANSRFGAKTSDFLIPIHTVTPFFRTRRKILGCLVGADICMQQSYCLWLADFLQLYVLFCVALFLVDNHHYYYGRFYFRVNEFPLSPLYTIPTFPASTSSLIYTYQHRKGIS